MTTFVEYNFNTPYGQRLQHHMQSIRTGIRGLIEHANITATMTDDHIQKHYGVDENDVDAFRAAIMELQIQCGDVNLNAAVDNLGM